MFLKKVYNLNIINRMKRKNRQFSQLIKISNTIVKVNLEVFCGIKQNAVFTLWNASFMYQLIILHLITCCPIIYRITSSFRRLRNSQKMFKTSFWCFYVYVFFNVLPFTYTINHPVILIPGDGGSQVNAKLNKKSAVHYICQKKTNDFFNLWLNIELLLPIVIDCWVDNMSLRYNKNTRTTENAEGVEIEIPGFGNSTAVEWIDPSKASPGAYFKDIANLLVSKGYVRNLNLRGAPYDFRKGPNENREYFLKLIKLIEETYKENGNQSVILIAHSMGGPMAQLLLEKVNQNWKDKYVRALVGLSGAWGGSVKALKVYAVGDNLGAFMLRQNIVKAEQISSPSLAWLLPSNLFWKPNEVLVETAMKNYTVDDFHDFFKDIDYEVGWEMYKDVLPYRNKFLAPGVEVHCLHGYAVETTEKMLYRSKDFPLGNPELINGDGDGTVNRRSLEACIHWQKLQKQKVYHQAFPKVDHMDILRNKNVLSYLGQILQKI